MVVLCSAPFLLAFLALAGCVGGPKAKHSIAHKKPLKGQVMRGPQLAQSDPDIKQCLADLGAAKVRYASLPDRDFGGGCSALGSVQLLDIGTPVTNLGAMKCPLARTFAAWAHYAVRPAARQILGSEVVKIETMGTYSCRNIIGGSSGKLSQHALSNAVDVSAFLLADGRRIAIKGGWTQGSSNERKFLKTVHDSACKRFQIVLSPDYNSAHHDHMHFDMGRGPFCK